MTYGLVCRVLIWLCREEGECETTPRDRRLVCNGPRERGVLMALAGGVGGAYSLEALVI